jgi:hypothetical protein
MTGFVVNNSSREVDYTFKTKSSANALYIHSSATASTEYIGCGIRLVATTATITNLTASTLSITTAATADMMDMAAATAGNLLVTTTATIANLTASTVTLSAGTIAKEVNIGIATTGASPTFTTQADFNKLFGSAGRATGGGVSSAGTDSIAVSAGTGFIKATDSDIATLISFNWSSASSIAVATNTTTYVYISYNSGVPTIATTTVNNSWDLDTSFPLATVVQENNDIHILNNPWWVTDGTTNIIERIEALGNIRRDDNVGGLILSADGTRQLAVTAGILWSRLNEVAISVFSYGDSFEAYWRTSSTLWAEADATTLSNIQLNNLSTNTLDAISNNKYVNFWVYAEADDKEISVVFPQAEYVSAAGAEAETPPTALPAHIGTNGILLGRVIVKQATTAPVETQSAFTQVFGASQAADHGNLTGLGDDDHTQYVAVTGTRSATIPTLTITTSATIALENVGLSTIGNLTITTGATITGGPAYSHYNVTYKNQFGWTSSLTANSNKGGGIIAGRYAVAFPDGYFTVIQSDARSDRNDIVLGGGVGSVQAATKLSIYTAVNTNTAVGTERVNVDSAGTLNVLGNMVCGLQTAGTLFVTTSANIGLLTAGTLTVTTSATITTGILTNTNFRKVLALSSSSIYISDGTAAAGNLSGVAGDICMKGGSDGVKAAYCSTTGTTWVDM